MGAVMFDDANKAQLALRDSADFSTLVRALSVVEGILAEQLVDQEDIRRMLAHPQAKDDPNVQHHIRHLPSTISERPEELGDLNGLSEFELAWRGNMHYRAEAHWDAIEYWERAAAKSSRPAFLYFNQGLAYNQRGQDADAVDMWRRALNFDASYEPARRELKRAAPRLLTLADEACRDGDTVVNRKRWYASYLSPLELLDLADDVDLTDERQMRKRRKALLHEIELQDGRLPWLPGTIIERSRALSVLGELDDFRLRRNHALVYSDKRLLAFLSRGVHRHFLVDTESLLTIHKPENLSVLEDIARNPEFRAWLSGYFAQQYGQVLALAINRKSLPVIECLMSGRRWVLPSQEDDCFERARRMVDGLIERISDARKEAAAKKPRFDEIERLLDRINLISILNLLPTFFESQQTAAVGELRQLSIECYNIHRDSALSRQILDLTRRFRFKTPDLSHQLDKDYEQIENLINEEKKYELQVKIGRVTWEIAKNGIRNGNNYIGIDEVVGVRLSADETSGWFVRTVHYFFGFRGERGERVSFRWKDQAWIHRDMLNACLAYVVPHLVARMERKIARGETVRIGPFAVTNSGVSFKAGLLFTRWQHVPWPHADIRVRHGTVFVADRRRSKVRTSCSVDGSENIVVLSALAERKALG